MKRAILNGQHRRIDHTFLPRQRHLESGTAPGMSQPPWDSHYGTPRPDDFNSQDPAASFAFPYHVANPPTPVPTDSLAPSNHVSHDYMFPPGATGSAVFPTLYPALEPVHTGAVPVQNMAPTTSIVNWGTSSATPGPVQGQGMFCDFGNTTDWEPQPTAPIASSHAPAQGQAWENVNIEQRQHTQAPPSRSFRHRLGLGQRFRRSNPQEKEVPTPNPQDTSTCWRCNVDKKKARIPSP